SPSRLTNRYSPTVGGIYSYLLAHAIKMMALPKLPVLISQSGSRRTHPASHLPTRSRRTHQPTSPPAAGAPTNPLTRQPLRVTR
ncbi:MAG: hypothetical protein ACPGWR_12345, partial [Ardenticatenaceae bacterium]